MPIRQLPLEFQSNATTRRVFTLRQGTARTAAEMERLPPFDLTGCTLRMQVRKTEAAPEVLFECSTENGRFEMIDPAAGRFALVVNPEDFQGRVWSGTFDVILTLPEDRGGDRIQLFAGKAGCKLGSTR